MKLTNTLTMKRKAGMTLLELTVVILVLLSLISILFVGARAWKKGSDRSANIMNVRNVQQAVRGHQNTNQKLDTDSIASTVLFGTSGYMNAPTPPITGVTYSYGSVYGAPGTLYVTNPDLGQPVGDYFYTATELSAKTADW